LVRIQPDVMVTPLSAATQPIPWLKSTSTIVPSLRDSGMLPCPHRDYRG